MDNTTTQIKQRPDKAPALYPNFQDEFLLACEKAGELQLADKMESSFAAAQVVQTLRNLLNEDVVCRYFMPLMGVRVGFLTDRDKPKKGVGGALIPQEPYPWTVVRDAIIDAACIGLAPVKNQINIIAGNMYPTKEGFTKLLKNIGCKYLITTSEDKNPPQAQTALIECRVDYEYKGEKKGFVFKATPKKDGFSSLDQLKGKAERKAKKCLYEYLTGTDLGDADEDSGAPDFQPQPEDRVNALREKHSAGTAEQPKLL